MSIVGLRVVQQVATLESSATCIFTVVVCSTIRHSMFAYICHAFISEMCLFKSVFGLTVYVYSCVYNIVTRLFIVVVFKQCTIGLV